MVKRIGMTRAATVILSFLLFMLIVYHIYFYYTININDLRHLTNSYTYAHFSKINAYNYFLFPSFVLQTHPMRFTLNEGESLYIPKNWWHWIVTVEKTTAVNFWFSNESSNMVLDGVPRKINNLYTNEETNQHYNQLVQLIENEEEVCIWNSDKTHDRKQLLKKCSGKSFLQDEQDSRYLMTLHGYGKEVDNTNIKHIKQKMKQVIPFPHILNGTSIDMNLWVSGGYHDTGLHYDDNDGILYVLKGKKQITLYPPSDSKYILPYDIIPNYANEPPIYMMYNENTLIDGSSSMTMNKDVAIAAAAGGLSSQMLLYHSLRCFSTSDATKKAIQNIYDAKQKSKRLVWGCKNYNGEYRWEVYNYHYGTSDHNNAIKNDWQNIMFNQSYASPEVVATMNDKNTIINSIDILNDPNCFNAEHHTYERVIDGTSLTTPFYGAGYDIIHQVKHKMCTYIYDTYDNFFKNKELYFEQLDLPYNIEIERILHKYKTRNICLCNKHGDYFIQWLKISVDDFIHFLQENNYGECFIQYVIEHKNDYAHIPHEVTIVFHRTNMTPFRSGFYGCL